MRELLCKGLYVQRCLHRHHIRNEVCKALCVFIRKDKALAHAGALAEPSLHFLRLHALAKDHDLAVLPSAEGNIAVLKEIPHVPAVVFPAAIQQSMKGILRSVHISKGHPPAGDAYLPLLPCGDGIAVFPEKPYLRAEDGTAHRIRAVFQRCSFGAVVI